MKWFRSLYRDIRLFFNGIAYGMKGADEVISQSASYGSNDTEVNHQLHIGGVLDEMLQGKETQQVKETRDAYYRILFEADNFSVDMSFDEEGELKSAKSYRNRGKWIKPADGIVDMSDGLKVRVIQDNDKISKESNLSLSELGDNETIYKYLMSQNQNDYLSLLTIDREDITPRFFLEKYVTKMAVKNLDDKRAKIELYLSQYQEQYNKVHALFLNEIHNVKDLPGYESEIFEMKRLGFITNGKAWGSSQAAIFSYENIEFKEIKSFDGSFIIVLNGDIIKDGENVGAKYRTKELDQKYDTNAPKSDTIDIFTAERHLNDAVKGTTTLKLS